MAETTVFSGGDLEREDGHDGKLEYGSVVVNVAPNPKILSPAGNFLDRAEEIEGDLFLLEGHEVRVGRRDSRLAEKPGQFFAVGVPFCSPFWSLAGVT